MFQGSEGKSAKQGEKSINVQAFLAGQKASSRMEAAGKKLVDSSGPLESVPPLPSGKTL